MAVRSFLHYSLEVPDEAVGQRFFFYLRDPWDSFSEYYFDLDYIPENCAWEPRDFPPEDSLYVWGPPCPADFGENKEAWT